MPKCCFVQLFIKLGIKEVGLGEIFGLPKKTDISHILSQDNFCSVKYRNMQASGAFLLAFSIMNSCHNELVFPLRKLDPWMDHILASVRKRLSNDPS